MSKPYIGVRLRSLRARHGLTQAAMAQALGLSPSYFNQLEKDQRPLSAAVLRQLQAVYGVDAAQFAGDGKARLATDLRAALAGVDGDVPEPEVERVVEVVGRVGAERKVGQRAGDPGDLVDAVGDDLRPRAHR